MRLNIRLVECFQAVITMGTVTAAAELLNTSQSAVSRSIQQFEGAIGMKLFERRLGRLFPTAAALLLHEDVKKAFLGLDHIQRAAANLKSFESGSISVASVPAFSEGLVSRATSSFSRHHTSVSIAIETQISADIAELVSTQRFDLGLCAYDMHPSAVHAEPFAEAEEVCVLPVDHALANRDIIYPKDLHGLRFIFLGGNDPYRFRLDKVFDESGFVRKLVIETRNSASACSLVALGAGVSIVNPFTASEFIDRGLVLRRFSAALPFRATLLRPKFKPTSPLVDLFIKHLHEARDATLALAQAALRAS